MAAASGEFIACLDADDWVDPQYVEEALRVFDDPEVVVALPFCHTFGDVTGEQPNAPEVGLVDAIRGSGIFPVSVFRRARWDEIGGFYEGERAAQEDWEHWTRGLRDGGVARRVHSAVVHWRIRPGSRSSSVSLRATRQAMVDLNRGHERPMLLAALGGTRSGRGEDQSP
ncbi:glycosyltransferase [Ornithinimicrobium cryptoxanthini]|uniref:glycosyltransferase n=1 Tax=Ornithinimicrobium cryptoxanthini TaxID=2934161 RepID=UPI00351C53CB